MLQVLLPPLGFITAPSGVYSGLPRHASKTIFVASPAGSDTTGSDAGGSAFFVPFIILNQIPSFMAVASKEMEDSQYSEANTEKRFTKIRSYPQSNYVDPLRT